MQPCWNPCDDRHITLGMVFYGIVHRGISVARIQIFSNSMGRLYGSTHIVDGNTGLAEEAERGKEDSRYH